MQTGVVGVLGSGKRSAEKHEACVIRQSGLETATGLVRMPMHRCLGAVGFMMLLLMVAVQAYTHRCRVSVLGRPEVSVLVYIYWCT